MVGMLLGFLAYLCMLAMSNTASSLAPFVFGGAAIGFCLGLSVPSAARRVVEATIHFVIGLFVAPAYGEVKPDQDARPWLKLVFWGGVLCGLALLFLLRW